ncbi:MAG: ArsR/SmtB family transcription factor [Acidobacteriaceae bacterium]
MVEATELFRALADPTRLAVFESVARREMTVSELTNQFEVSQPAISQHLTALRNTGLVSQRREGRYVYYRAKPAGMKPLIHWLSHYQVFWQEKMPRLKTLLKEMSDE